MMLEDQDEPSAGPDDPRSGVVAANDDRPKRDSSSAKAGGTPSRPSKRETPIRPPIDWQRAAEFVASGVSLAETARRVGCSRSQISRRYNHDQLFRHWMRTCDDQPPTTNDRLGRLRRRLHQAIDSEVKGGNVRVIL